MKSSYDIILYFSWVHCSHIHKYFALKEELNKHADTLLILDNGKFGVSEQQIKPFNAFLEDVVITDLNTANQILFDCEPKILVLGSDKQTLPWQRQINQQLKSTTIQLPHFVGVDIYYSGADFLAVLGPVQEAVNKNVVPSVEGVKNKININPWLYDLNERCLPNTFTREEFCKKYSLNPDKEIFIWLPDMQLSQKNLKCFGGGQPLHNLPGHTDTLKEATSRYKDVCSIENVVVKVHPNEFKSYNQTQDIPRWSYEISDAKAPVIDPVDTHWAYKYSDCGIGYTTSAGIEFGFFETPFIYLDSAAPQVDDGSHWDKVWMVDGKNYFSWVGHEYESHQLKEFLLSKDYKITDSSEYQKHREKLCFSPNEDFLKVLAEKILSTHII